MAGEHDFAPLSEAELADLSAEWRHARHREWRMARELRASRAAMRALVEAVERGRSALGPYAFDETDEAWASIRALVAHVGRGAAGEGR